MDRSQPREGYALWLFKIVAGCFIIVLLGVHFIVNHLVAPGGLLTYTDVLQYYTNPFIPVMEIAFLLFAISHSLIGLRSIIMDLNPPKRWMSPIDWILVMLGLGASSYGIWLVLVVVAKAQFA